MSATSGCFYSASCQGCLNAAVSASAERRALGGFPDPSPAWGSLHRTRQFSGTSGGSALTPAGRRQQGAPQAQGSAPQGRPAPPPPLQTPAASPGLSSVLVTTTRQTGGSSGLLLGGFYIVSVTHRTLGNPYRFRVIKGRDKWDE